jgi:hypothetical protein
VVQDSWRKELIQYSAERISKMDSIPVARATLHP